MKNEKNIPSVSKSYIIAEIGQAHDGSLGAAHAFIDIAADCGVDAVKFQMHIADVESGPEESWRKNFSYQDSKRYDYWKRIEFTLDQWRSLKKHCEDSGVEFICSAFSQKAAKDLLSIGMSTFKVASGEVNNYLFLDFLAANAEHVILSTGMSSIEEIKLAHDRLKPGVLTSVLQCTTNYPVELDKVGLNNLVTINEVCKPDFIGLSDHSGKITPAIAAFMMGARVFENHICLHEKQFGPDTSSSLTPTDFKSLVQSIRECEILISKQTDKAVEEFEENRIRFGKSLSINKDLKKGDIITEDVLDTRKPAGEGIHPSEYQSIMGKALNKDMKSNSFIKTEDLE